LPKNAKNEGLRKQSPVFFATLKAVSFPVEVAFLADFASDYSTVTLFAKFLGWSTLLPRKVAIW
jgi:hypothetical protein